jgi:hypothetical protein
MTQDDAIEIKHRGYTRKNTNTGYQTYCVGGMNRKKIQGVRKENTIATKLHGRYEHEKREQMKK